MADNIQLGEGTSGKYSRTKEVSAGVHIGKVIPVTSSDVEIAPLTDTQLRATPVPVSGTVTTGGLTDTQLRAAAVPVSVATIPSHAVTNAGTFAVQVTSAPTTAVTGTFYQATQPVSIATAPVLVAGTALIGKVGIDQVTANANEVVVKTAPTTAVTNAGITSIDGKITACNTGAVVLAAGAAEIGKLAAGSALIGKVGIDQATANANEVVVKSITAGANLIGNVGISGARTSGGTTPYKNLDVDESEDEVKGAAGQVYWIHAVNLKSTPLYLKFYNATAANVTVGTTTPVLTFPVPSAGATTGAGFNLAIPNGIVFDTAITIAATTGVADNDTGAPGANELVVNLGYA
jgi:hypothetical protein